MHEKSVNVLVVDDHTLFRKGMAMLLSTFPEVNRVHDVANGREAIETLEKESFNLLLLDLDMPIMDGWETSVEVLKSYPEIQIIMISVHDSPEVITKLIDLGVHGYLLKTAKPDEVQKAIESVTNHGFYYNKLVAEALHHHSENTPDTSEKKESVLTKREVEVVRLICQEMTMREIGEMLFLSEQTIQTHRKNILKKTDSKNTVALVKYAIQNKIISL